MEQKFLKEDNIFIKKSFKDKEEALEFFSDNLMNRGKVLDGFKEALLEREKKLSNGFISW
jgi:PTS system galactitol-specific IIA component